MNSVGVDLTKQLGAHHDPEPGAVLAGQGSAEIVDGRAARWAAHREQRRDELIKAARKAVHRLGPGASMEEIAATAGTSKSVFYRYFGDKAGLQQAVGEVVIGHMQETVLYAAQSAQSPLQGLKNMVSAYLNMAQTSPNVYAFATQNLGMHIPGTPEAGPESREAAALHSGFNRPPVPVPELGKAPHALGSFFDAIGSMVASSLGTQLNDEEGHICRYWPTAAIGLVRTAGELWLSGDPRQRPSADEMAEEITRWLFEGVASRLSLGAHVESASDPAQQHARAETTLNPHQASLTEGIS